MPEFVYTAKNAQGQQVQGSITAAGAREAITALSQQALYPMRVEAAGKKGASLLEGLLGGQSPRVKSELVAGVLSQLSDLLASGVPLLDGLDILASQATQPTLQKVLTQIRDDVADGTSLDEALARHPRVFPDLIISIVRAGSAGAFLEAALAQTADFLGLQEDMKSRVKGAMAYPVFLAIMGSCVTVALVVFFVPKFAPLFTKLEEAGGLPWTTIALLWLSDVLWKYGIFLAIGMFVLFAWCRRWMGTPRGQEVMDDVRLRLPLMGPIIRGFAVSRCCRILGTLLRNGVPLLKSLAISADAAGNKIFSTAIRSAASNVSSGETLSEPLAASRLFPPEIMAMVRVAEQSNNLDVVLLQIADRTERRNIQKLDILVRLVEPALLLIMGSAMLFVIVALLLPVFDMGSAVG